MPRLLILLALSLGLSACGFTPFMYRPDVVQGNVYDDATIALIRPGMSRDEVHRLLGTPVLQSPFHSDRDNYLYRYESGTSQRTRRWNPPVIPSSMTSSAPGISAPNTVPKPA